MLPFAFFKNKRGRECGEMQIGYKFKKKKPKKTGKIGQSSIACHHNSCVFKVVVCVGEGFFFCFLFFSTGVSSSDCCFYEGKFTRHLCKPSSHSSPLLHGTKRPVCFRSGGASRPIWMCCCCYSGPHLLSLSFTAWYLPSVKPAERVVGVGVGVEGV